MKKLTLFNPFRTCMQIVLLLAITVFNFGTGSAKAASTNSTANTEACGQLLQNAEAAFRATLNPDGSVLASPEARAAAQEYIRVAKICYASIEASNSAGALQEETPSFIDNGGMKMPGTSSEGFALTGAKWGFGAEGTPGGKITYSFMGNGISFKSEGYGNSVAITSLPTFQPCFITKIQNAFAAWQAVANVQFVQVDDNGAAFDAAGAVGDIRIAAHAFDGPSNTLAHAYFPPPNGNSAAGDLHFDSAENWSCNASSGYDIGMVALHEIGHSLGLNHETTNTVAVMDPTYNSSLISLQPDDINGIETIYGTSSALSAAPSNDAFASASTISTIPYTDTLDTTGATEEGTDPKVPGLCDGHNLNKGAKTVWYKYTPVSNISVSLDTIGSNYDTYIAVWKGSMPSLTYVGCDDDTDADVQSQLILNAAANTTYYIEIAGYTGFDPLDPQNNPGGTLVFNVNLTNVNVTSALALVDRYYIRPNFSVRRNYANLDSGPMKVASIDGVTTILASQRYTYSYQNSKSYAEMMGYPGDQLATEYWFPWYNDVSYSTQLRISNMGSSGSATIKVFAGTTELDSISLLAGQGIRKSYGVDMGPLHVFSTDGTTPILVSERFIQTYKSSASYAEMMGYPGDQLATTYWFPWYNNVSYSTQLRVSNLGGGSTTIKVYAGATLLDSIPLAAGQGTRKYYNVDQGPLHVFSQDGVTPILASERFIYTYGNSASYAEMMGYPGGQLTSQYCFPWYNNLYDGEITLSSQLRMSNLGNSDVTVTVYVAGVPKETLPILAGQGVRKSYAGVNNGPLCVTRASGTAPILASERFISTYLDSASYSEMMGYPTNRLAASYWFPWYNNISYSTELRISKP